MSVLQTVTVLAHYYYFQHLHVNEMLPYPTL